MTASHLRYRADLHVHSHCSGKPYARSLRALRARESYTAPIDVYRAARARGMDFVTITDHNTLDGSLAIAHLPGAFLSAEFDTWFPENGCRVHVVALGIDEPTFALANLARRSIYDLVACLREAGVVHYLAHPLFDMTGRLTHDTVEKLLLLFNILEGRNGSRVSRCNGLLREIAASLTPEAIEAMAVRQGIAPYGATPWRKALTGGSDDHTGLFVAGAHTAAGGDGTVEGFLAAVAGGDCEPLGSEADSRLLAHSIYTAAFWRIREILRLDEPAPRQRALGLLHKGFGRIGRDVPVLEKTVRGVRSIVPGLYAPADGRGQAWEELLEREIGSLIADPDGLNAVKPHDLNRRLFEVSQRLANDVVTLHLQALLDPKVRLGPKRWLQKVSAVGLVGFLQLPHLIAWLIQTRDRDWQRSLRTSFLGLPPERPSPAVITGGPAGGRRQDIDALAQEATDRGLELSVIAISSSPVDEAAGAATLRPLAWRPSPNGDSSFSVPPLINIVDHLDQRHVTALHCAVTSEVSLAALAAARLLHLPVSIVADEAKWRRAQRGGGGGVVGFSQSVLLSLYGRFDLVLTGSRAFARELIGRGLDPRRVGVTQRDAGCSNGEAAAILAGLEAAATRAGVEAAATRAGATPPH